jgi:hypothetical protein
MKLRVGYLKRSVNFSRLRKKKQVYEIINDFFNDRVSLHSWTDSVSQGLV